LAPEERPERASTLVKLVGLSGGMQQRVNLVRALAAIVRKPL
jgi:ABC-type proline/glycine betaine transport system ATPase subunit